jgi:TonB family protein
MDRRSIGVLLVLSLAMAGGCASTGTAGVSKSGSDSCPPASGEKPYTISVSNHGGAVVSPEIRQSIANALAGAWGYDDERLERSARYVQVARELNARIPKATEYTQDKWRTRAGDSAVALLTYRRGQLPELDLQPQGLRDEFFRWITKATGVAVAQAFNERAVQDTMPLHIDDGGSDVITLELRFGRTPPPDAAVAVFALREREPRHRSGTGPRYPDAYRQQNIEGAVLTGFIIDSTGEVDQRSVRIVSSDGELFTASVRQALRTMKFEPHMVNCQARAVAAFQPFNFSLYR